MNWFDVDILQNIIFLIRLGWDELFGINFDQIEYPNKYMAVWLGICIALIILLKWVLSRWLLPRLSSVLFGRNRKKYSQKVSGHFISGKYKKVLLMRFIFFLPILALAVSLIAVLFAITDPFLPVTKEEKKYVEARIIVSARDESGSMAQEFLKTGKSKAEIAANAHLEFLKMRAGKGDRSSFWVFSNNPYLIQDFTVDEDVFYQQVYDAPWEMGNTDPTKYQYWEAYLIPKSRYAFVRGESGTEMEPLLKAIVDQFDRDEKRQSNYSYYRTTGKALLILTDAAISDFDKAKVHIDALSKKNVTIYVILIEASRGEPNPDEFNNINPLLRAILNSGGKYYSVNDPDSLLRAYQEIDSLEKVRVELQTIINRVPLYDIFIFISIISLILIIPIGLFFQLWEHP